MPRAPEAARKGPTARARGAEGTRRAGIRRKRGWGRGGGVGRAVTAAVAEGTRGRAGVAERRTVVGVPPGGEASFAWFLRPPECVFGVFPLLGLGTRL